MIEAIRNGTVLMMGATVIFAGVFVVVHSMT